jgi:translation initiation factor 4E
MAEEVVPVPADSDTIGANPLASEWVFWYFIPNRSGSLHPDPSDDWSSYLHPLHSFDAVEDFGRIMNSVEHPSKLLKGCRYYVFRKGVRPLWEDPAVAGGSVVFVEVEKEPDRSQEMESKWIEIVLDVIGSAGNLVQSVLGIEDSSRPNAWRISIRVSQGSRAEMEASLAGHFEGGMAVQVQPIVGPE